MIRKIVKIAAISVAVILLLLIALPFVFKGKIVERVKYEINEQLDARVEFGAFGLSLVRNFPNASLRVSDLRVIGEGAFEGDTLADIGRTMISIDLFSLFGKGGYEINSILLDHPTLLFKLLEDGAANWDVVADTSEEDVVSVSDFSLSLKRVKISSGNLRYVDEKNVTYIDANGIDGVFRADMRGDITTLSTSDATIASFSLRYDKWPVMSRVKGIITAEMEADLERMVFTFRDNLIQINDLPLVFEGMVGWPEEDLEMDFRFGAARSDFGSFISLIPVLYMKDFEQLKTSGNMKLEGHVKGVYADPIYPGFGLMLEIDNGMFQYPDLPASLGNVNITASILNPGKDLDLTVVDVPRLSMNIAGAPLTARFHLTHPISDPRFDLALAGQLDLSQVERFYPLEAGMVLRGMFESDLEMSGALSSFNKGDYNAIHASGNLTAKDVYVSTPMLADPLEIATAELRFTPMEVRMESFSLRMGESDLAATGQIHNLPGYLFDEQLLRGTFTTTSSYFDLNSLMEQFPDGETTEDTTANAGDDGGQAGGSEMSAIRVPANIDFTLNSDFDKVRFGKLEMSNVKGIIQVAEEQAILEKLQMDMLGGSLELSGFYDSRDLKPYVNLGLNILGFDIVQAFENFNTVRILAPIAEFARGNFSANLQLSSLLSEGLMPILSSLKGKGGLKSSSVLLQNVPSLSLLADQLKMDQFKEISLKDLALSFAFADEKVELPPIDLKFGDVTASIAGITYFDRRISYAMVLGVPRAMFGSGVNQVLSDLFAKASVAGLQIKPSEVINLDVLIGGSFLKPEVSLSMATMRTNLEEQLRLEADRLLQQAETRVRDEIDKAGEKAEAEIQDQIDDARDKVDAEVEARVSQVMDEARRQADTIREQAGKAADAVRAETATRANQLEQEADGPLAKAAARQAGQQMIREAERRAAQLEAEGERNAQRLIDEASAQAERIRSE